MSLKLQKANFYTAGDRKIDVGEDVITNIELRIHKFNARKRPVDKRNIVIFPLFSEFGCETLAVVYCLPKLLAMYSGKYTIVMGWQGRSYLYKHLVDEFWEMPEEYMWLREYARAFHNVSRNVKRLEKEANKIGNVVDVSHLSNVTVFPKLEKCPRCEGQVVEIQDNQVCIKCKSSYPKVGLFSRTQEAKKEALWLPEPSPEKMEKVKKYLPPNAIGITARKRKTWGRNLESIFYERLIYLLENMGYNPVWIGEKVTSLPCPFKRIVDYSSTEDAKDLETTFALVKQLKFTIQFWTASTRLAALVGTTYLIFESPDQIWGIGQEGIRLNLITRGNKKLVVSHYRKVVEDNTKALDLVYGAVSDIEKGNFDDVIGLVENKDFIKHMKSINSVRIGDNE